MLLCLVSLGSVMGSCMQELMLFLRLSHLVFFIRNTENQRFHLSTVIHFTSAYVFAQLRVFCIVFMMCHVFIGQTGIVFLGV